MQYALSAAPLHALAAAPLRGSPLSENMSAQPEGEKTPDNLFSVVIPMRSQYTHLQLSPVKDGVPLVFAVLPDPFVHLHLVLRQLIDGS